MFKFIGQRILFLIPILLVVSFIVFAILHLSPIDPAFAYLTQSQIPPTQEALELAREELGLNLPFWQQYGIWLKNILHLDFGISYVTKRPVLEDILYYLPTTLNLAFLSMIVVVIFGIVLGVLGAIKKDTIIDRGLGVFAFIAVSTPSFWLGFLLIYGFTLKLGILSPYKDFSPTSYILPVITLSLMSIAINMRLMRVSFLEHQSQRSVLYAYARGLSQYTIHKHILKNSILPIVTSLGMHFGELLGGAVIVEILFGMPGFGRYAVGAIYSHDYPVIQAFMLLMVVVFIVLNLLVDIALAYLNPKIRYKEL
ncbi:ABC transporter permease subunit [Helicobacter apodemus]|uniref:ABC transporter permease subunit n=1 Tax=Helicobacter apodemus TaxID=135569 RepID=A0A4U8UFL2_9HELI|nr:ABC transporter permease subunit [Helicobacter apodemus]MDE6959059.1 ABC transporter permease subunit [Helicobacter apodemus]TLE15614.1 ABC transporter permease subunit [Helicobacter apodemus]